jgi:hypothetical protein
MALVASCAVLLAVGIFALVAAAAGHRMLPSDAEHLLCSIGLGVIATEVVFFFAQLLGHIRLGVGIVLAVRLFLRSATLSRIATKRMIEDRNHDDSRAKELKSANDHHRYIA